MSQPEIDVTGIGNAIVDVLGRVDDAILKREGLVKGSMSLVDAERAVGLYALFEAPVQQSGGSAGNTIAGLASLGASVGFVGKIAQDELGTEFARQLGEVGATFVTPPSTTGIPTARCMVMVSPDAQRTMSTFLGACVELGPEDVPLELVERSRVTYLEGYLWDPPLAKEAFLHAARIAHGAGRVVALSLSDSFCVARHRDSFREFVRDHVDVLFANESEVLDLYQVERLSDAIEAVRNDCRVTAITRGADGCAVVWDGEVTHLPAAPVARVVDTTGAGDLFAAGFLFGYARGLDAEACGRLGAICAAEVISHFGARPERSLAKLATQHGLL